MLSKSALSHATSPTLPLGKELILLRVLDNPSAEFIFSNSNLAENKIQKTVTKPKDDTKTLDASWMTRVFVFLFHNLQQLM